MCRQVVCSSNSSTFKGRFLRAIQVVTFFYRATSNGFPPTYCNHALCVLFIEFSLNQCSLGGGGVCVCSVFVFFVCVNKLWTVIAIKPPA